jgi:hypothetical protein
MALRHVPGVTGLRSAAGDRAAGIVEQGDADGDTFTDRLPVGLEALGHGHHDLQPVLAHPARIDRHQRPDADQNDSDEQGQSQLPAGCAVGAKAERSRGGARADDAHRGRG